MADTPSLSIEGPKELRLDQANTVKLKLVAPSDFEPTWTANVGQVSGVAFQPGGYWEAQYTPPEERYPQVALIAALSAEGDNLAVHRIDLLGSPKIKFQSEPRIDVNVYIGEKAFGPVKTDRRGRGEVKVQVPPGLRVAETRGTDNHGNSEVRPLPLDVPPFNRHLLICSKNGEHLFLWTVSKDALAPSLPDVELTVESGSTAPFEAIQPGLFASHLTPDPDRPSGLSLRVEALENHSGTAMTHCLVELPAAPVVLTPPPPAPVAPQSKAPRFRLGAHAGLFTNFARITGPSLALRAEWQPLEQTPEFSLGVQAGVYWSSDSDITRDLTPIDISYVGVPALVRIGYEIDLGPVELQGSAGLGAVVGTVSISTNSFDQPAADASVLFGGSLLAGYPFAAGTLQVEAGYWLAYFEDGDISGNVAGLNVSGGYAWRF